MQSAQARIIWALDPLTELGPRHHAAPQLLCLLGGRDATPVEPVCVLSPSRLHHSPLVVTENESEYCSLTERHLNASRRRKAIPLLTDPSFIYRPRNSTRGLAQAVAHWAEHHHTELIAVKLPSVSQPSRRFFRRSFAEALLRYASTPLVIVSPKTHPLHAIGCVLFATDLSSKSLPALEHLLPWITRWESRLVIYHRIPKKLPAWLVKHRESRAEALVAYAEARGIEVEVVMQTESVSTPTAILTQMVRLDRGSPLLAMAPTRRPLSLCLRKSVVHEVIRRSVWPIWIDPPRH